MDNIEIKTVKLIARDESEHLALTQHILKNLAKDGRYYWVFTTFEPDRDLDSGEIFGYKAFRKAAPKDVVEIIEALYKELLAVEKEGGMEASFAHLQAFLHAKDPSLEFQDIMENIHKFY